MALAMISWLVAIPLLGLMTGLRTMTPIAVFCWFAYLGYLPISDTWAFWTARLITVITFTVLAAGELIGDKLPKTPPRTAPFPLIARLAFGGLIGALGATALNGSTIEGAFLGVIAAALGAFGGFHLRHYAVQQTGWPDWRVAVIEDAFALICAIVALSVISG